MKVYRNNRYMYDTDCDGRNRPWFGKTWGPADKRDDEIAAAIVWDEENGKTSRWSIKE